MGLAAAVDILVLCYHAVSDDWRCELAVTPARLEEQVASLLERGYVGATFHQAVTEPVAPKTVAVTFDDGFRSVVELGYPILARLGVAATLFAVTDWPGGASPMRWDGIDGWADGPHAGELLPASWEDLGRLADAGWEIGSHTCTHPYLTHCDDRTLAHELRVSRERCEEGLGRRCASLAYPYGDVDERVASAAAAAGYATAATLPRRPHDPAPLLWPRVGVWRRDGPARFRLKVSPRVRRLRGTPHAAVAGAAAP